MKAKTALFLLCMLLAASSCTVEKQLYSRGFHVEFHKRVREADSHNTNLLQPLTEVPEKAQVTINPDSIADRSMLQEKEIEAVSDSTHEKINPATKPISVKLKRKIASGRIGISIQTHFSESLMSKSLKKDPEKRSEKRDIDIDWEEVLDWVSIFGLLIGLIILAATTPGVNLGAFLVGILVVAIVIILLAFLIANALDGYEWFWSGR